MTSRVKNQTRSHRRHIAIASGGTAGHVYPALALGAAYQKSCDEVDLLFIGTSRGLESRLVPQHGYRFRQVPGSPLFGAGMSGKLAACARIVQGTLEARRVLQEHRTKLVIGFGGYASAGALLAAQSLGLKTAIHEANIVPGMTNRFFGRFVDRVYLGFEASSAAFSASRTLVSGNPVRSELTRACRKEPEEWSNGGGRPARILVTGGSGGSPFLNDKAPILLARIAGTGIRLEVRHQAGNFHPERVRTAYLELGIPAAVSGYIDDMRDAYHWADFAVACSGSGTLAELAVVGLPALLVPLTRVAGDHQAANAAAFARAGAGIWVREDAWRADELASQIRSLLRDANAWKEASRAARRLAVPNAADAMVADCEAMMAGQW